MKKTLTILSLVILALLASCADEPVNIGERTSVEIKTGDGVKTRTILPTAPDISTYTVTLDGESEDYTNTFAKDVPITFDNVLVGAYTVKVEAKDSDEVTVATGSVEANITASGSNSITVPLEYLTEGTGRMEVEITWDGRTNGQGPFDEAVKGESLGFQAKNNETGEAYGNLIWADEDDLANKKLTYVAEGLAPSTGTTIYFDIYTKVDGEDQVIARTFYTVVQVISNLTSRPDSNETDNFKITDESIIQYLKNVIKSTVTSQINAEDPEGKIDITWNYPKLSNGTFNASLTVSLYRESDDQLMGKESFEYSNETDLKSGRCTFGTEESPLSPTETYYVTFQNRNATGYSQKLRALDGIRTKVKIENIELTSTINEYYTMGDTIDVVATITPDTATDKRYTISVDKPDGVTIDEEAKTVTFNRAGDYTITVTATDNAKKQASQSTYVKLSTPGDFELRKGNEGIRIYWDAVESATGYEITRTVDGLEEGNKTIAIESGETTEYLDTDIYAGKTHTYSIKAVSTEENGKYNSEASSTLSETTEGTTISIIPPADITAENLPAINFNHNYLVDGTETGNDKYSLSVSLASSIEGATLYEWLLNGVVIKSGTEFSSEVQNITITVDDENVKIDSSENENSLMLRVTVEGKQYSTTGKFYVVSTVLDNITITNPTGNNRVTLGTPLQLDVEFTPSVEELGYTPTVTWSVVSENNGVIELSENGLVTAINDGEVTIRVTADATGVYDEITVDTYIPAEYIEITNTTGRDFMFMAKTGVTVENGFDEVSLSAVAKRNDDKTISEEARVITWSLPANTSNLTLSATSGETVTAESVDNTSGGDIVITVATADITNTRTVHIHDMDIYIKRDSSNDFEKVTGGTYQTYNISDRTYNMKVAYSCSSSNTFDKNTSNNLNVNWCFSEGGTQVGSIWFYVTITNQSSSDSEFYANLERDGGTVNTSDVTAIINYGDQRAGIIRFTTN